ncbi:hypothetical protein ACFWCB_25435 [Streptomyces sp. NPDC060048]|uniref:hypothetical protein n=1 Tax=unclassified Streptomyces TaxID=2593676 RepID=UPI0036BFDE26
MDLSPSAWLEAAIPYVLAAAAVTLACVAAFALAVFAVLRSVQRRRPPRRLGDDVCRDPAPDGLAAFTWTPPAD